MPDPIETPAPAIEVPTTGTAFEEPEKPDKSQRAKKTGEIETRPA